MTRWFDKLLLIFLLPGLLGACRKATPAPVEVYDTVPEVPVTEIALSGPIAAARAEISGMAWCDAEHLILLPQYPALFTEDGQANVFSIAAADLDAYLSGESTDPIQPELVPFDAGALTEQISGFEGYEAVAFYGEQVFVTVEARAGDGMLGYLVGGSVTGDCSGLVLYPDSRVAIQPQADLSNMSDETIIVYHDQVHTVYEANGLNVNPDPVAHRFDMLLTPVSDISFPTIEYRITDATTVDEAGVFWAINYFYPGDTKLKPATDLIAQDFGLGVSHQDAEQVERLVAFEINAGGITWAGLPPIYLTLEEESRNFEGLVRYDDGFLLVTDEYPTTILGYVED